MSTLLPNLTFNVVRMPSRPNGPLDRFVAVAWNYDYGQLIATKPCGSYSEARALLDGMVQERGCALRWFDGEYEISHDGGQMFKVKQPTVPRETEDDLAHQA